MNNNRITINTEQAEEFAFAVFADIADFVNSHSDEYEEFLSHENLKKEGN